MGRSHIILEVFLYGDTVVKIDFQYKKLFGKLLLLISP